MSDRAAEELRAREPLFHHPELGTTRADFEAMTDEGFWEVGASGRRYSRAVVLDELEKRYAYDYRDSWEIDDFACAAVAAELYLVTYTLRQGPRVTRRATLWRRTPSGWKALYHQGTLVRE